MGAPNLTFSVSGNRLSGVSGFDRITVVFQADAPYKAFECRVTKSGEAWGREEGTLAASFSRTPANTPRQFDIFDGYLLNGDGEYRIGLYVQGEDGSWNETCGFVPSGSSGLKTEDGKKFMYMRWSNGSD